MAAPRRIYPKDGSSPREYILRMLAPPENIVNNNTLQRCHGVDRAQSWILVLYSYWVKFYIIMSQDVAIVTIRSSYVYSEQYQSSSGTPLTSPEQSRWNHLLQPSHPTHVWPSTAAINFYVAMSVLPSWIIVTTDCMPSHSIVVQWWAVIYSSMMMSSTKQFLHATVVRWWAVLAIIQWWWAVAVPPAVLLVVQWWAIIVPPAV
jgi:hypothetical protein